MIDMTLLFQLMQRPHPPAPARVFDHIDGGDMDRLFSRVARRMRSSAWWQTVPSYTAPQDVSGKCGR